MRILFWGTPDFAVPPLRALIGEGYEVVGVVTQPDRPRGRSRSQLDPSPVKRVAVDEGIPVLQPEKPRGDEFMQSIRELSPDISVVVAYGHILPRSVIELPPRGTLNIHASILPQLRGAAPIQGAILGGLVETGVTIMHMVPALDAGAMLHILRTPIPDDETYGELHERLAELGALAIVQALALVEAEAARPVEQDESQVTWAPKITREMTRLDFSCSAIEVCRRIRAFDPRPGAFSLLRGKTVKCFGGRVIDDGTDEVLEPAAYSAQQGTILQVDASGMVVRCGTGAVRISQVQPSGKARISPSDWVRGRGAAEGDRFDGQAGGDYLEA